MKILEFGNPEQEAILLIHGFECPWHALADYIDYYGQFFHVFVPLLPGHDVEDPEDPFLSLEDCAWAVENFCRDHNAARIRAVYAMSMGGLLACRLWADRRVWIDTLILESSPLLPLGGLLTRLLERQYQDLTRRAQERDPEVLQRAARTIVQERDLSDFLRLMDHMTPQVIHAYLASAAHFRLPIDLDEPPFHLHYFYGGKREELPFRMAARSLKKHYPAAETHYLPGKGHCEDALLHPQVRMEQLSPLLGLDPD